MADEPVTIYVTEGPDRGSRLTVPAALAKQAIKEGWARDPFAPPSEEDAPLLTAEKREKIIAAATRAARKLRGEPDPDVSTAEDEDTDKHKPEERDMTAGEPDKYETRDMPEKRGPGRPPKT
jgi:hypothetical protein